jgi:sensor histidine kinase YesM
MKAEKSNTFLIKRNFLFFKIFLWGGMCLIFTTNSVVIPTKPDSPWKELLVFLCLVFVINVFTSFLYPKLSKKRKWKYIVLGVVSILFCVCFEMFVFYKNFITIYYDSLVKNKLYLITVGYIFLRNAAFFGFFLWVEYYNRLILLFYENERIYQKERLLLHEKQEFEKKFSRVKLLPHYFFNILENVIVKPISSSDNRILLDKVKFILYYFLVDAEREKVDLEKELEFYKYYIELENLRHHNKIVVSFNILGQTEGVKIIPLLFEPLISNAMKYTKHDGDGKVEITVNTTRLPDINFYCKNNYSNQTTHIISSESGLKILEQRLELCYRKNYFYEVIQNADMYEVVLSITLV